MNLWKILHVFISIIIYKTGGWTRWPLGILSNLYVSMTSLWESSGKLMRFPILFRQHLPVHSKSAGHISLKYLHLLTIHNRNMFFKILWTPYLLRTGAHRRFLENIGVKSVVRKHSTLWWKMCQMDIIMTWWRAGRHKGRWRSAIGNQTTLFLLLMEQFILFHFLNTKTV